MRWYMRMACVSVIEAMVSATNRTRPSSGSRLRSLTHGRLPGSALAPGGWGDVSGEAHPRTAGDAWVFRFFARNDLLGNCQTAAGPQPSAVRLGARDGGLNSW
jgi:hypothetical protein